MSCATSGEGQAAAREGIGVDEPGTPHVHERVHFGPAHAERLEGGGPFVVDLREGAEGVVPVDLPGPQLATVALDRVEVDQLVARGTDRLTRRALLHLHMEGVEEETD